MLAVIASIREHNNQAQILFVCSGRDYELKLLEESGIDYKIIPSGKYRRYGRGRLREALDIRTQLKNAQDVGRVARAYAYSRKIIRQFKPDAVFIKGGYVGLPVGLAAGHMGVPYVIHESDVTMGRTNQKLSKKASAIAVTFPIEAYQGIAGQAKMHLTGNPVRPEFYPTHHSASTADTRQKPNILIFAGSQGAEAINENIFDNIELFCRNFNLLHITGEQGIERALYIRHKLPTELQKFYEPVSFLTSEMAPSYRWADVVVARAGMNSLAELAAMSKPAIIIPLPSSTANHQLKNALYLAKQGAIRILPQDDMEGVGLVNEVSKLTSDPEALSYISSSVHKFFRPQAADDIARLIVGVINSRTPGGKT